MSTMKGNYCWDASKDYTHLQDMGSDAAVVFGYYDKSVSMWIKILSVCLFLLTQILSRIYFAYNFTGNYEKKYCYQIRSTESKCVAGWKRCNKKILIQKWQ